MNSNNTSINKTDRNQTSPMPSPEKFSATKKVGPSKF